MSNSTEIKNVVVRWPLDFWMQVKMSIVGRGLTMQQYITMLVVRDMQIQAYGA